MSPVEASEHIPVLADELVGLLEPERGGAALDCTFGSGGHSRAIARRLGREGSIVCVDRDPEAAARFDGLAGEVECDARFVGGDFADVIDGLAAAGESFDVACMDLGVSSQQLDRPERGFSYSADAPLDMRMDPGQELSAREVVNDWPTDRLAVALRELGEERHARAIAAEIGRRRPLATTFELVEAVRAAVPPSYRFGRGHPAKRTFQAIRIAVNGELDSLDRALPGAWGLLADGGRLGAISFHSLEDRRVKRFLAERARECVCPPELPMCVCSREPEAELITRRAVAASPAEAERNPRARSARLRVARKLRGPREDRPGGAA
ncbi:MAG: 16S rRNA (cytosine(1402)-N(4))-methyltransferase RsmH [Solirubrobacterales bacterium]